MKKIVAIVIIFLLFGLAYKLTLYNRYYVAEVKYNTEKIFNETISAHYENNYDKEYEYEDLVMRDDFSEFESNGDFYYEWNDHQEILRAISITKTKQYYLNLVSSSFKVGGNNVDELFTEEDRLKFVSDNNINNDINLFAYVKKNYYLQNSVFDSITKLKNNYIINSFVSTTIFPGEEPNIYNISLINGDLTGYVTNINYSVREIHLMHNDEQYIITLVGSLFTDDDYITEILNTIKFK